MFRKRTKKHYPPGTFIAMPARVAAILQLCLAFTILLWHASLPFMGDLFAVRSKMAVYDYVMGIKSPQQRAYFERLPQSKQEALAEEYAALQHQLQKPISEKLTKSLRSVLFIQPFELAWLCLAIAIPILLLKRVEGAIQAAWLLPLLAAAYAIDNRLNGVPRFPSAEERLFPSESILIAHHLGEPLNSNLFEQRSQLKKAWDSYLIAHWSGQAQTLEAGEYAFQLARLEAIKTESGGRQQEGTFLLASYFVWNVSFALLAARGARKKNLPSGLSL